LVYNVFLYHSRFYLTFLFDRIGENGMRTWWNFFKDSPYVDFIHTSGGQSQPYANIKNNELSWQFMNQLTGRKIIADTGKKREKV
jgi:hypothetical protein